MSTETMADIRQHFKVLNSAVQARVLMSFLSVRKNQMDQMKVLTAGPGACLSRRLTGHVLFGTGQYVRPPAGWRGAWRWMDEGCRRSDGNAA